MISGIKINEPVGDANYGPLFLRMSIGSYFILAALTKLSSMETFIEGVRSIGVIQGHAAMVYSVLLPYMEFGAGVLLVLGFWTTLASIVASLLLCSFLYVFKIFPFAGNLFNKDLILLSGTLCLMFTGAGAFSIDKFRRQP